MQSATGITEPDYGIIFDDTVWDNGAVIPHDQFSNVRVEIELAFLLSAPLSGPRCTIFDVLRATEYVVPALEILNSHIELAGRTIVDTIATKPSRKPESPQASSTTRPPRSRGWRTNCTSTAPNSAQGN